MALEFVRIGRPWPRGPRMALLRIDGRQEWWPRLRLDGHLATLSRVDASAVAVRKALSAFQEYHEPRQRNWPR
jgi:hypothetical protein